MPENSARYQKSLLILIGLALPIAFFLRLNSYQLIFEEPRRALVALEMLLNDNWLAPTTNGVLYYNKPPLYNWVLAFFLNFLGKAEWVVRLPSILSLFATAAIHYHISKKYIGKNAAVLSALFFLTSADILFYFSLLGEIDLFYALVVYLQSVLIFHLYSRKQFAWLFIASYALAAVGALTKGIPSIFFQAITLPLIFLLNKDFRRFFSLWHLAGLLTFTLLTGGYFYLYSLNHEVKPYLARLFTETFSRTAMEKDVLSTIKHLVNFPLMLIKITAPWCIYFALSTNWRRRLRTNKFLSFCFWFCVLNGALYLLSPGTRERYLYMFLPFIFSLLTVSIYEIKGAKGDLWMRRFYYFIGITVCVGLLALSIFAIYRNEAAEASACLILTLITASFLYSWKLKLNGRTKDLLFASILLILFARIGFDIVILPTKKEYATFSSDAKKMAEIADGEPIYLVGNPEMRKDEVSFAGRHFQTFVRKEPAYLAFQTSFYLSALTGKVIRYTEDDHLPGYYLRLRNEVRPDQVMIYYTFKNRLDQQDIWYVLYRRKPGK